MEYDVDDLPLGSVVRAKAQLQNNHLHKAIKTCKTGAIALDLLQPELKRCLDRLYKQKVYGMILSAYYEAGEFGHYSVDDLLRLIYTNRDYPTFLKQAYRFNAYDRFRAEIQDAINWHYDRNLHDAPA